MEGDISELINRYSVYGKYGEIKEEIIRQTYMESMVDKIPTIWCQDDKSEESHYWHTYCLYEQSLLEIKNDALGKVPDSQEKDKICQFTFCLDIRM